MKNEQRILGRLQGLGGCPQLVGYNPVRQEVTITDFDGVSLDRSGLPGMLDLPRFLAMAENLAHILATIHGRGVIHKDLKPGNILVRPDDLSLQIIDFGLAATFAEEPPIFDHTDRIRNTSAYMSPEQTGRMNRPIDYRTDLYSLGATLYSLATGAPPFERTDTLQLVHALLALSPQPPNERATWLPDPVSDLILTLLAKEPADRYQSAAGLAQDLQAFRRALAEGTPLTGILLKTRDLPLSPRPSRRLYGRDRELEALMSAFGDMTRGGARGLFVGGYSGIGKTALIHEIHRPLTLGNGLFITGKFEQFQRDRPFLAPSQSLQQLCQLLLAEPESAVHAARQRILDGVGLDAAALFEVVPELESLLGPLPAVSVLGPLETQLRLRTQLVALLRQVASPAHPLVLFLDDLQWADQPSLDFMAALLEEPAIDGLLLIGAYREHEVDVIHPLLRLLNQPTASGKRAPRLTLDNLTVADITAMLADMLQMRPEAVGPLAEALYAKTDGNPYFTIEFLNALHRDGVLWPDADACLWRWDAAAIFAHATSANVVEFLAAGLSTLTATTTDELVAAACLGNATTLGMLASATGTAAADLVDLLMPALERGIIVTPNALAFQKAAPGAPLRFCHDRMQQAVYQLRDDAWRCRLHLAIARRFADPAPARPIAAAEHYAVAASLVVDPAERAAAGTLFLNAAVQARQAGAFATAERFLRLSIGMQGSAVWDRIRFTLHAELHVVLYSQSLYDEADAVYAVLADHAPSPVYLVDPACVQVASLSNRTRFGDALTLGAALLERLGIAVPTSDLWQDMQVELDQFYRHVEDGALERIPGSAPLTDAGLLGAAKLMNRMEPCAFFSEDPTFGLWIVLRNVRMCIEHGYFDAVIYPLADVIGATVVGRADYATGYRSARVAIRLIRAGDGGVEAARAEYIYGAAICHWFQPVSEDVVHARAAFARLVRDGDLEFGCYSFFTTQAAILETCAVLTEMQAEIAAAFSFTRRTGNRSGEQSYLPFRQLLRALEGNTALPGSFDDAEFDEQAHLVATQANPMAQCYFHIYRALAACVFQDDAALIRHAEAAALLERWMTGMYPVALAYLLHALALIARIRTATKADRPILLERLAGDQSWLAARAADAPMNFAHLHDLVEAERLDVLDRPWESLGMFEQAMRRAQGHQRPWHQALITERAGWCNMRHGLEHGGRALLGRAHDLYRQWGAVGKARALRDAFPFLAMKGHHGNALDYDALLRASRVLASETSLACLVAKVVELVGQLAGATDVRLMLLDEAGFWQLEGGWRRGAMIPAGRSSLREVEESHVISTAAMRLTLKTMKPLVSDDAVLDSRLMDDRHFSGMALCSLLALPVVVQGRVGGFLVMENDLYRAAFSAGQIEVVSMLTAQLAISIENARLYRSLEAKVAERTHDLEIANAQLQLLSEIDVVTGIANRRKFDTVWGIEWQRIARTRQPLAVALVDVDHFKAYNDHYGHQAGDISLRDVAQALAATVRQGHDLVARYGGEEFVVVMPGLTTPEALQVATRLIAAVAARGIPHAQNSAAPLLTVSVGVASHVPQADGPPAALLADADAALYQAKRAGRNRARALRDSEF